LQPRDRAAISRAWLQPPAEVRRWPSGCPGWLLRPSSCCPSPAAA